MYIVYAIRQGSPTSQSYNISNINFIHVKITFFLIGGLYNIFTIEIQIPQPINFI